MRKIILLSTIMLSTMSFAETNSTQNVSDSKNKEEVLEALDEITKFYMDELAKTKAESQKFDEIIASLESDIEALNVSKEEIEVRKNLIKELYIDLEDTKNLYIIEFDEKGNIKQEIKDAVIAVKQSLNDDSTIVKIKLPNGKHLPLIKYKVKNNDTLKKILLHTYPEGYKPTWNEVSKRIDNLVSINKNIIKMNHIYPGQTIYIPLFKDNPTETDVKENIINQKKKKL